MNNQNKRTREAREAEKNVENSQGNLGTYGDYKGLLDLMCKFNMASKTTLLVVFNVFYLFARFSMVFPLDKGYYEIIAIKDVEQITREACILAFVPFLTDFSFDNDKYLQKYRNLQVAFEKEPRVHITVLNPNNEYIRELLKTIHWKDDIHGEDEFLSEIVNNSIILFPRRRIDRTCLTPKPKFVPTAEYVDGNMKEHSLLMLLNSNCQTFRTMDGGLTKQGQKRENILKNLYHLPRKPSFPVAGCDCERIKMPSKGEFINEFLYRSRPVIIEGALRHWPSIKKWTNRFLETKFGKNEVHIKLTPDGVFEGCEKAKHFSNYKSFKIPDYVAKQLPFSDMVVVRPATMNLNFSSFMEMIRLPQKVNISAYLEYSSIPDYMPQLEDDIQEFAFIKDTLTRKHLNLWLSNGHTLGKLHFDPYENFLCQISGTKQIILFEPHNNTMLYEGHIQESILGFDQRSKKFSRTSLLDSTSMVMSPIDILKPDYDRFPKFKDVPAMNCTIGEGDVLYMPSFWWHEVQSTSSKERRNLAVNFWYEPFLTKEFPCAECAMDINTHYHHMLL